MTELWMKKHLILEEEILIEFCRNKQFIFNLLWLGVCVLEPTSLCCFFVTREIDVFMTKVSRIYEKLPIYCDRFLLTSIHSSEDIQCFIFLPLPYFLSALNKLVSSFLWFIAQFFISLVMASSFTSSVVCFFNFQLNISL